MSKPGCLSPAADSLYSRIAGCQVSKPRCLSPAADSLYSRIAGCQVSKPRCLRLAADSLYSRIADCQVSKPRCLSPAADSLYSRIAGCLSPWLVARKNCLGSTRRFHYLYFLISFEQFKLPIIGPCINGCCGWIWHQPKWSVQSWRCICPDPILGPVQNKNKTSLVCFMFGKFM